MTPSLPLNANIPLRLVKHADLERVVVRIPSWTQEGVVYHVVLVLATRELLCDCDGFFFHRRCNHIARLTWFSCKPRKRRGVSLTSILSYDALKGSLGDRQRAVLDCLDGKPLTDKDIASRLGWTINCVTGRRGELVECGAVIDAGTIYDESTQRHNTLWAVSG